MRKNMAPRKKQKRNKKTPINKKTSVKKQKSSNDFSLIFAKVISTTLAKPFFLINLVINRLLIIVKNIFLYLFNLIKQALKLLLAAKEAFFSILFGQARGGMGEAVPGIAAKRRRDTRAAEGVR